MIFRQPWLDANRKHILHYASYRAPKQVLHSIGVHLICYGVLHGCVILLACFLASISLWPLLIVPAVLGGILIVKAYCGIKNTMAGQYRFYSVYFLILCVSVLELSALISYSQAVLPAFAVSVGVGILLFVVLICYFKKSIEKDVYKEETSSVNAMIPSVFAILGFGSFLVLKHLLSRAGQDIVFVLLAGMTAFVLCFISCAAWLKHCGAKWSEL